MFDVSFGEVALLTGIGIVLIGRKDLPFVSHALGRQVGRVVGLLQGARLRADRFATDHQLKQLQNEFRSGLRELDAVKAELAGAMTTTGSLGAMVPGVDRRRVSTAKTNAGDPSTTGQTLQSQQSMGAAYLAAAQRAENSQGDAAHDSISNSDAFHYNLAPRSQSVAAVAEEEWEKRGIGFQSIAERGAYGSTANFHEMDNQPVSAVGGGASILSNFMRQSLIYDQYERTVREQDEALRTRVEKVRNERTSMGHPNTEQRS
ncbi:hypothetical protein HJC23_000660 [Cyclotella cryptica]|uniref:Sec-independent protein translocase protein TatB n=1 Tax=Cyclotella cryptica TaxID=29204 RepID=A0ABD3Q7W9_9STRA|eukprot:CCRYP_008071-RA/>CCRYP_008071-RA protein AED:0.02 eAED:0.02 QI:0/-1/0/1/-1/1/1/0/260